MIEQFDQQAKAKKLKKTEKNLKIMLMNKKLTINSYLVKHMHTIENIVYINQNALMDPINSDQTVFSTVFYFKGISGIQVSSDGISIKTKKCMKENSSSAYLLKKWKSYNDKFFYQMADKVQNILKDMQLYQNKLQQAFKNYNPSIMEANLKELKRKMGDKRYMFCVWQPLNQGIQLSTISISKGLGKLIGYDDLTVAVVEFEKFQSVIEKMIGNDCYPSLLMNFLQIINFYHQTVFNGVSENQFTNNSQVNYFQKFYTRDKKLIHARYRTLFPYPWVVVTQITDILAICQQKLMGGDSTGVPKWNSNQLTSLKDIIKLPKNMLYENKDICCGYRIINQDKIDFEE